MAIPSDYLERVYAGVLGKIIGVYLGRPFEGWQYGRIMRELGEITEYVHERLNAPLIVTDDDISGTFTFLRAMPDYGNTLHLTPKQIGQTWLNYLIEKRTVLWWGGMGNSTEHTAYLRLKHGIPAPESGSIALNGKVVAEQIGAQIFIDGWGMICPGDPELAADLARRAGSVSHDGEAIYGAQVVAAIEALAFVESDMNILLDKALSLIPKNSVIARMITDLRNWYTQEKDWRVNFGKLAEGYGYHIYGGNCHMVPNHGLIILALLHGEGDFSKSLMIVNTCGWDTDCNSGNVGCILGIRNGLTAIDASSYDWRTPVADKIYIPTADGGRCITDAVRETYEVVNIRRTLEGLAPLAPKNGARYHFELPGSVQAWQIGKGLAEIQNLEGHSKDGTRSLALRFENLRQGDAYAPTFIPPSAQNMPGYGLMASPTLYSGQKLNAGVSTDAPVRVRLFVDAYDVNDKLQRRGMGRYVSLEAGENTILQWRVPNTQGSPIARVGVEVTSETGATGTLYLDYLTWDGAPEADLTPVPSGQMMRRAWVSGVNRVEHWGDPYRIIQDEGTGLLIQGTREWTDYQASATITPHLTEHFGLAVRVQGMQRYYALRLENSGTVSLVKALDGERILASRKWAWEYGQKYALSVRVRGNRIQAWLNDTPLFDVTDPDDTLEGGAIGLLCRVGRMAVEGVWVNS
jgi:ADP-ribosylglycohydrolase